MSDTINIGAGTSFSYSTDNGSNYTALAKIMSITPPKVTVAKVSVDAMDNTTVNGLPVEDQIPGWITPGTWGLKIHNLKSIYNTLRGLIGTSTNTKFKCIKSDGSGYVLSGYISEVGDEIPLKEVLTYDLTIQVTGGIGTFSAAQS